MDLSFSGALKDENVHPGLENKYAFCRDQVYEVLHILQELLHPPLTLLHNLQEVPEV